MKKLRAIIVDDERVARSRLRRMLEKEADIEIVEECSDGASAVESVRFHAPELLLLDIHMTGMDGFDVLDALGPAHQPPAVIFVTAFDEHAVRAFEACALDYVLKPTSPERFAKTLARVRQRLAAGVPTALTLPEAAAPVVRRFAVRSGGRLSFVGADDIDWIEAAGNYAILHAGRANHMIRETMSGLEEQLAPTFLRLSRSTIVNLRRVKELCSLPTGEHMAVLFDDQRIAVTRSLREVRERLAGL